MNAPEKFGGYDKARFPTLTGESFDCIICFNVVKDPQECTNCGSMFCNDCIKGWLQRKAECPAGCPVNSQTIKPIGKALLRLYNDLDTKCAYCTQTVKLSDLEQHESLCSLPNCANHEICKNKARKDLAKEGVCSEDCLLLKTIRECGTDYGKTRSEIESFLKKCNSKPVGYVKQQSVNNSLFGNIPVGLAIRGSTDGITNFSWDGQNIGTGIELSNNRKTALLKESAYMFRTIIGDTPLTGGVYYWEIHADSRTDNELKIGVATKKDFNYNSAFCDYEFGYSYYGLGQLRHNSNAAGGHYGKKFKKEGVLGVFLDMNKGTLSFALNGEYFGPAYTTEALKKGPIYPAISLLHCAGLTLVNGKPAPSYFF